MVIDENDELHVAYAQRAQKSSCCILMVQPGTMIKYQPAQKFGPVGIAVDSNNMPHVSFAASVHTVVMDCDWPLLMARHGRRKALSLV